MKRTAEFVTFDFIDQMEITGVREPKMLQIHTAARDGAGRFYLSDEFNHRIVILDSEGNCVRAFGKQGNRPGEFWYPRGLAVVESEGRSHLVVCDAWNHRIQRFNLDGDFIGAFGSVGEGEDQFNEPVAVIPGEEGRIWILDRCNHRIKLCAADGETVSIIGRHLTLEDGDRLNDPVEALLETKETSPIVYGFNYPQAFTKRIDGNFVIADTNNNRLCLVSDKGEALRFISFHGNEPPYFYPLSLAVADSGLALVRGVHSSYRIIDLNHPWRMNETLLAVDDPFVPPAVFVSGDGENANAFLFDGRKGTISKLSLEFPGQDLIDAPSRPLHIDSENISYEWVNSTGGYWLEYLSGASETEQTTERIKSFYATCRDEAKKAANELTKLEGEYLKRMVDYYKSKSLLDKAKAGARPEKDLESDVSWKLITLRQDEKRRTELRKVLIRNLGWIVNLFESLSEEYRGNILSDEESELAGLLEDEYRLRKEDFDKVISWLKESLPAVDTLNASTALHVLAGILILIDHIKYLSIGLKRLHSDVAEMREELSAPEAILRAKGTGAAELTENILNILVNLCLEWGHLKSAKTIVASVATLNKPFQHYSLKRSLVMEYARAGDFDLTQEMLAEKDDETNSLILGELSILYGRSKEALDTLSLMHETMAPENPLYEQMRNLFINALIANGKPDEALSIIESSAESKPDPLREIRMAQLHFQTGRLDEAIHAFRSVHRNATNDSQAHIREQAALGLAHALSMKGCAKEALEFLDNNPATINKEQRYVEKATQLRYLGKLSDSITLLERALANQPNNITALCNLGLNRALSGYKGDLRDTFEKAAESGPRPLANLVWGMSERIAGKCADAMNKLTAKRQDKDLFDFKIAFERIVAALCADDDKELINSLDNLTRVSMGSSYRDGISFYADSQESLMERAMKEISARLEKDGIHFTHRKLYSNAVWYSIEGGYKDSAAK